MSNTVFISTERCGSSQATTDDHEESSRNGQEGEGEVTAPSVQASKLEDFQGQLHSLDLYLLKYFRDYELQHQEERGQDAMELENFTNNLTPKSKKVFNDFSPKSRSVFKKGFEIAQRLQVVSAPSCSSTSASVKEPEQTPVHGNNATNTAG